MTTPPTVLLALLSAAAMAAPGIIEQAHAVAHRSTPTTTCVTGVPASTSSPYPIEYATVGDSATGSRFYDVEPAFNTDHAVGSAMVSRSSPLP